MANTLHNRTNSTDFLYMSLHFHAALHGIFSSCLSAYTRVLLIAVACIATLPAFAEAQQPAFKCTRLTTEDGLSDNMVFCALQDKYGFMWFGTRDGLNKYDGHKFTVYTSPKGHVNTFSDATISYLYEDRIGNIWMGTQTGIIMKFDRHKEQLLYYKDTVNEAQKNPFRDPVHSICEDISGNLWITTWPPNIGLRKLDPITGHYAYYKSDKNRSYSLSGLPTFVCRDSMGRIWVGTRSNGLNQYDAVNNRFINDSIIPNYGFKYTGEIHRMRIDTDNTFWVTDTSKQVRKLSLVGGRFTVTSFPPPFNYLNDDATIRSTLQLSDDQLWIGIRNVGIHVRNIAENMSYVYTPDPIDRYGLISTDIFSIYQDKSQNIWICTAQGVNKVHHRTPIIKHFHYRDMKTNMPHNIRALYKDPFGNLWVGTEGRGLLYIDEATIQRNGSNFTGYKQVFADQNRPTINMTRKNTINIIYHSRAKGIIWIGTNNGLFRYSSLDNQIVNIDKFLSKKQIKEWDTKDWRIWSIQEDQKGDIWFGTLRQGAYKLHIYSSGDISCRKITDSALLGGASAWQNEGIFSLIAGQSNHMWIGSNQGLYRYDQTTGAFTHYAHRDNDSTSLSHNHVWYIHQTASGILWLGTSGGGLNMFNPRTEKFKHYTEEDGLPSNIICGILEDDHGNLWISTNRGLSKFTPSTGHFRNFGIGDGLYISEFHFKTCFKDTDGTMYFGGMGGYIEFHPDSIRINQRPPLLALTSFKVFDKELELDTSIAYKKEVLLKHSDNYFSIEFTALDFTNPVRNKYRYKLNSYDEQWRETDGTRPYASYTTVPPGTYTFSLQASNSDGVWNTVGTHLSIVILPAWWQTMWFRSILITTTVLILAGLGYWRYRHMKHRNLMEKKLVESQLQALRSQMNPHFIFNSLNSILHFITSNDAETAHVFLSKFSKLIRATLEHSRSEFIILSEEIRLLSIYLELEALRFDHGFTYELIVDPSIDIYAQQIPPLLIQPYVENAIKHGLIHTMEDGKISVIIRREGHQIVCSVIDNGIGRLRAQELKKQSVHKYISRGISLTKDRLDILNSIHSERYGVEINDLTDNSGHSRGTRVDIRISSVKGNEPAS